MSFQTAIKNKQSPSTEGDFASSNVLESTQGVEASYISGENGVKVGTFVWVSNTSTMLVDNFGLNKPAGFVTRQQRSVISGFKNESSLIIKKGIPLSIFRVGDFWARNIANPSVAGHKVYAKLTDGTIRSAIQGTIIAGYVETDFRIVLNANINELTIISRASNYGFYGVGLIINNNFGFLTNNNGNPLINNT